MSSEEDICPYVFKLMSKLLEKHRKMVASHSLKLILHWVQLHIKRLNASTAHLVMTRKNHLLLLPQQQAKDSPKELLTSPFCL